MSLTLQFLGGVGTVTGSKYLLDLAGFRFLIDCGLFQGHKELRERNWAPFPVDPSSIHAVLLTHAHLDHSGYLPALVRDGFKGPVITTSGSRDLCRLLLTDSAHLMEADAAYANRREFSRHQPALPLYRKSDVDGALSAFTTVRFGDRHEIAEGVTAIFRPAGHILGAATIEIDYAGERVVFSGDLGRYASETMVDPAAVPEASFLVVESTYGGRRHDPASSQDILASVVSRTIRRGGSVVIPAFAVGRAQSLLFHLSELRKEGRIGHVPIYLDSPMAVNASEILCSHLGEHRLTADQCRQACSVATYVRDTEASKRLNRETMPKVIISASGMATGGRVLHHLKHLAPDHRNTIMLAGFQAAGTRGAALRDGARELKIHGERIRVRAEVVQMDMMSAHADAGELIRWLRGFSTPPVRTFVTHGEPQASAALASSIKEELGWTAQIPSHGERVTLTSRFPAGPGLDPVTALIRQQQ